MAKEEEAEPEEKLVEPPAQESLPQRQNAVGEIDHDADTNEQISEEQVAEARRLREAEEMAAMDKLCIEAFLTSVKRAAWRAKVRTPIKGTNLYTKHMRPCRPVGTSVDVKDSNFRNLATFLQFLEAEGLLCLKPG